MENLKALMEKRAEQQAIMDKLVQTADTETRAMSEDEAAQFDAAEKEVRAIDDTIAREEKARAIEHKEYKAPNTAEERAVAEENTFVDYVMGKVTEMRAGEQNVTMSNNSAIVPSTIANQIIKAVKDRCPILAGATIYNVKGTLKIPVWGDANSTHNIAVGLQSDFTDIVADAGKFTSVDLGGYLAGAMAKVGKQIENNGSFSVTNFIVNQMAEEIAIWIEGMLLTGTGSSQPQGAVNTTNTVTAADDTTISADDLVTLQAKVKQCYQANACWTMHPDTFTAIRKLKDSNNRYLLQDNVANGFPYMLLGKPVYLSDNMQTIAASAKTVLYGDYSGLAVNFRENIGIDVYRELLAAQHALAIMGFFEMDSKVVDNQKLAVLVQAAS